MTIFDSLKDKLADWGLTRPTKSAYSDWLNEKEAQIAIGRELEPPWFYAANEKNFPPEWGGEDNSDLYAEHIWMKFWNTLDAARQRTYVQKYPPPDDYIAPPWAKGGYVDWVGVRYSPKVYVQRAYFGALTDEERFAYFKKWPPPTDDWFDIWTTMWDPQYDDRLVADHQKKLDRGEEIEPPWKAYSVSFPNLGWEYGEHEYWKMKVWLPFWRKLTKEQQENYLKKWPPPNEDWQRLITVEWAGKLRHTERWHAEQKRLFESRSLLRLPWDEFADMPAVYEWDETDRDRWLKDIWIPYWNDMTVELKEDYCKSSTAEPPVQAWLNLLEGMGASETARLKQIGKPV